MQKLTLIKKIALISTALCFTALSFAISYLYSQKKCIKSEIINSVLMNKSYIPNCNEGVGEPLSYVDAHFIQQLERQSKTVSFNLSKISHIEFNKVNIIVNNTLKKLEWSENTIEGQRSRFVDSYSFSKTLYTSALYRKMEMGELIIESLTDLLLFSLHHRPSFPPEVRALLSDDGLEGKELSIIRSKVGICLGSFRPINWNRYCDKILSMIMSKNFKRENLSADLRFLNENSFRPLLTSLFVKEISSKNLSGKIDFIKDIIGKYKNFSINKSHSEFNSLENALYSFEDLVSKFEVNGMKANFETFKSKLYEKLNKPGLVVRRENGHPISGGDLVTYPKQEQSMILKDKNNNLYLNRIPFPVEINYSLGVPEHLIIDTCDTPDLKRVENIDVKSSRVLWIRNCIKPEPILYSSYLAGGIKKFGLLHKDVSFALFNLKSIRLAREWGLKDSSRLKILESTDEKSPGFFGLPALTKDSALGAYKVSGIINVIEWYRFENNEVPQLL